MDEFIKSYITSSAWSDATNGSLEPYGEGKSIIASSLPATGIIGNSSADNLNQHGRYGVKSTFADGNVKYEDDMVFCSSERSPYYNLGDETFQPNLTNSDTYGRSYSLQDATDDIQTAGSFESEIPHSTVAISSSIDNNGSAISAFSQVLGDAHSITSFPATWPLSYTVASSFTEQSRFQGLGFHGVDTSGNLLYEAGLGNDSYLNSFNAVSLHQKDEKGFQSFEAGQHINLITGAMQSEKFSTSESLRTTNQTNSSGAQAQAAVTDANGCHGVAKPRARARRGQATDPHSIAERLRREKIAERMKNLQELVPSSNKIDKASMLDEIMAYVKFLQLQVKVLSMSRLGAAGAVLPLLANDQTEGSGNVLVSSSAGKEGTCIFESGDSLAFEQEVVKLMETNVTSAVQYLQNKGLCLMPIALATAISNHKGSYAAIPPNGMKSDVSNGVSSIGSHNHIERSPNSGANSCNGDVAKQGISKAA